MALLNRWRHHEQQRELIAGEVSPDDGFEGPGLIEHQQGIEVGQQDIQTRIARIAAARGQSPAAVIEELQRHDVIGQMHQEIMDEKARGFLREHAKLVETDA